MTVRFASGRRRKVPVVRQYVETDCGPACLLSVLRFWGGDASVAEVRSLVGTDLRGSSLFQLANTAAELGFEAQGATGEYDDLIAVSLPAIAHVVQDGGLLHYVVVERITKERVWVMDPAVGRMVLSRTEFTASWRSRAVLLLVPTARLRRGVTESWFRWIARHLSEEQAFLTQSVFLGVIYTGLALVTSLFIQKLLDVYIPRRDVNALLLAGGLLLALLLCRAAAGFGRQRLLAVLQRRVGTSLNRDFVSRLLELPLSFFERSRTGDITARLQDCLRVQTGAIQIVGGVVIDGLLVSGSILGVLVLAQPLIWIVIAAVPLYGVLLVWAARELHARQNKVMRAFTDAEARYINSLQGIREVLGSGASTSFAARNHDSWTGFLGTLEQFANKQASLGSAAEAMGSTLLVVALVYGASLVMSDRLLIGQFMGGYTLIAMLLPAIARLADLFVVFQTTTISGTRVLDILHVPRQPAEGREAFVMERTIALENIGFTWPRGTQQFRDLNLTLERGRIAGLTGANGAGKTTLVKLLRREYEPTSGRLLVDGRDARDVDLAAYRAGVALVASDVAIFAGSVFENIALGRMEITPARVLATITTAGLGGFMQRFPASLDTLVGEEGRQLSAGERYVVGLLRALVLNPRVLVVDEAFALLDANTFRVMLEAIRTFGAQYAVLLISHDPAVLSWADEVFALEDGAIVRASSVARERPSHGERRTLIATG